MSWKDIDFKDFCRLANKSALIHEYRIEGSAIYTFEDGTKIKAQSNWEVKNDYSIETLGPTYHVWQKLADKEYVLEEYPNACATQYEKETYSIYGIDRPDATKLGEGSTEEEAWKDAANKLKEEYGEKD